MIKAIMAIDHEWGIAKNGEMPWPHNKEDLKQFKEKTTGHNVVMGSKTWNSSMPSPLPNRNNYVVTTQPASNFVGSSGIISDDISSQIISLDRATDCDTWIIGGAEVIKQTLPIIKEFHLTIIGLKIYNCDIHLDISKYLHDNFTVTKMEITPGNTYYIYERNE